MSEIQRLSPKQVLVMRWLGKKWPAVPSHGEVWTINGGAQRQGVTCTTKTLLSLKRNGLVGLDPSGCWVATNSGRRLVVDHGL